MKKYIRNPLFTFILGIILCGSTIYAATFIANNISYDNSNSNINANNVQDAIDELYTKIDNNNYEEYDGFTTYTPSKHPIFLNTKNKLLKENITINSIPDNYKYLSTATTATSEKILSGYTAYNNNGELITGNVSPDCVNGNFVWQSSYSTNGYKIVSFNPSKFSFSGKMVGLNNNILIFFYNNMVDSSNVKSINVTKGTISNISLSNAESFVMNNGLTLKWSTNWNDTTVYYTICK